MGIIGVKIIILMITREFLLLLILYFLIRGLKNILGKII